MNKILILGAAGNFGKRIANALINAKAPIIISGRNIVKLQELKDKFKETDLIEIAAFEAEIDLEKYLELLKPSIIINTIGPFQAKDYTIAKLAIKHKIHYIDLADGREFVNNISSLNQDAFDADVSIISGASTVPAISSAAIEKFKLEFANIDSLKFGISPGQKAERGLATTQSILSYTGKKLKPYQGQTEDLYGWQDIYLQKIPDLGFRYMANCDIPDLDIFAQKYAIKNVRFFAGLELGVLHIGLWLLSWIERIGIKLKLQNHADFMLKTSNWFDKFGSDDGGMFMIFKGIDKANNPLTRKWFLIAYNGDGPNIPTIPAIILAKKLYNGKFKTKGAFACTGIVSLEECLDELKPYKIKTYIE